MAWKAGRLSSVADAPASMYSFPTLWPLRRHQSRTFRAVKAKRHQRSPAVTPARIVNSPTLLTGLLRCAKCGAGMALATGKGGRYRYYKQVQPPHWAEHRRVHDARCASGEGRPSRAHRAGGYPL